MLTAKEVRIMKDFLMQGLGDFSSTQVTVLPQTKAGREFFVQQVWVCKLVYCFA